MGIRRLAPFSISQRVNRILNIVLVGMLLVGVRLWHLAVNQHDQRQEAARRPQRRELVCPPQRGTIRDRFNVPVAVNRVQYNASVSYAQIKEVPTIRWTDGEKVYARRQHVEMLSNLLADLLELDAGAVEDEIYSYAALFPNVTHPIKEGITEGQYYRLRMLEKDWPGLCAERIGRRVYPFGPVASHILGYVGAISRVEYEQIASEMAALEAFFQSRSEGRRPPLPLGYANPNQAAKRLHLLRARAYSLRDAVGKAGVESTYDQQLRGYAGKERYAVDIYGNHKHQLPGSQHPIAGKRVVLSLSVELQALAEKLLIQAEEVREGRSLEYDAELRRFVPLKQPWIKGGAIVALEPNTGEVLAMAGFPRYDPNDFIQRKGAQIAHWFETDHYIGAIWDGRESLERETAQGIESQSLTWERYLDRILPKESPVRTALEEIQTVQSALECRQVSLEAEYDQLLLLDLLGLVVDERRFSDPLLEAIGEQTLAEYRSANQATLVLENVVRDMIREVFHYEAFLPWREEHGKAFLRQKRAEEAREKRYQRPYLEHFNEEKKQQFEAFWNAFGPDLLVTFLGGLSPNNETLGPYVHHLETWSEELQQGAHNQLAWYSAYHLLYQLIHSFDPSQARAYLASMRSFQELDRPLRGTYRFLRGSRGAQTEADLAAAFYPQYGFGFARSRAFRQSSPQGSVFKIVTAYAALQERSDHNLNPLVLIDDPQKRGNGWIVGYDASGHPIPQRYKGGTLLRTHRRHVGEIDLVGALEVSSNAYFGLLVADYLQSPEDLNRVASALSYGSRTGLDLNGEYGGKLPEDVLSNRTGLYSYACGQHSIVVTPLQTACMLATIANGGHRLEPHAVRLIAGDEAVADPARLLTHPDPPYKAHLQRLGIETNLWTRLSDRTGDQQVEVHDPHVVNDMPLSEAARSMLLRGLYRCVTSKRGGARPSVIRAYYDYPEMVADYRALAGQLIGKTGTAEQMEVADLDLENGVKKYNHTWFAGVSFEEDQIDPPYFGRPELVVVVHLRYGDYGRECAPLAAQIVKKWREIKARSEG